MAYVKILFSDTREEALVAKLTSKSRIAPLNLVISGIHGFILRLELTAALVLADLIAFICKEMQIAFTRRIL